MIEQFETKAPEQARCHPDPRRCHAEPPRCRPERSEGPALTLLLFIFAMLFAPAVATAQKVHVLIVSGLAGEPQFRKNFQEVVATLADSAKKKWGVADSSLIVLAEDATFDPSRAKGVATRDAVGAAFLQLSKRVAPADILFVFLNGHGAGEGMKSRVNLPGADPTAADFATWLSGFAKQSVILVNAASGSGDFIQALASPGRLVVTATKTAIEKNETVFAKPFVRGLTGTEADADKDGRISVYEAFDYAKKEVARSYDADKRMLTEHAVLSDTALARRLAFGGARASVDPRVIALMAERQHLEAEVTTLRGKKASTDSAVYERELERLLLLVAEKSAEIRAASPKP